jgi:integrase
VARRDPVIIAGKKRGRPGRWIVHYYHAPGKRTWKTFKAREAAEEFRIETLKTRAGDPGGETDFTITLGDYAKHVWLPTVRATVKRLSARRYEEMLRLHVLPAFKDHKVRLLTRDQVKRLLVAKLSDGLSRPTVKLILSTLRALLNDAREAKIITDNPCATLGRKLKLSEPPETAVEEVKAFTHEELASFFDAAKQSPMPHGPLLWTLALTGLRLGEGVALRWSDVDVAQRTLHVQRALSGGFLSTTKSGRDRIVALSERAGRVLQRLQLTRADRAKRFRWKTLPEYIVTTKRGEPPSADAVRAAFAHVLKGAGLSAHHSPHSLRHTYASLLLSNGESLKFVQEQLGHSTIQLTADLYGKWAKAEPMRGGANYLDAMTRGQTDSSSDSKNPSRTLKGASIRAIRGGSPRTSGSGACRAPASSAAR